MNKKRISLLLIYFFKFFATSCEQCDCPPANIFDRTVNGVELKVLDTSDFENVAVYGTVSKNSFELTVFVRFELNQIGYSKSRLDFSSSGFALAYACSCEPDEYINLDPIKFIEIRVTDTQSQEITNVASNFATYNYNGEQIVISKLFENNAYWYNGFQLVMAQYDNIPNSSIFTVKIILESGIEWVAQTQEINFE